MDTLVLPSLTNKETCFIWDIKIRITIFLRFIRSQDSSKDNNFFLEKGTIHYPVSRRKYLLLTIHDGVSIRVYIYIYIKFLSYIFNFIFKSMYHQLSLAIQISSCITKPQPHSDTLLFVVQLSCTSAQVENRVVKPREKSL